MFKCAKCCEELRDGAQCGTCKLCYDFPCSGVTEGNYRKRKTPWKCRSCVEGQAAGALSPAGSPLPAAMDQIMAELKQIKLALAAVPSLKDDMQIVKSDLTDLKSSVEMAHLMIQDFSSKVEEFEVRLKAVEKVCSGFVDVQNRIAKLEARQNDKEQWDRMNNVEIKGLPLSKNENLFDLVQIISRKVNFHLPKEQINFLTRVPTTAENKQKPIVVCFINKYFKEDFLAAARKVKNLTTTDIGLTGNHRIFINDHLTVANKLLLSKTKSFAKERGFSYCWVKNCKILLRKDDNSPIKVIKTEANLLNLKN